MMTNKLLLTCCLVLGFLSMLFAQNVEPVVEWKKCFGSFGSDQVVSIITTTDGGYAFVGYASSDDGDLTGIPNNGGGDVWIVKISSSNNIQWQKRIGGSRVEEVSSIVQTTDGGYMVLATTDSNDGDVTAMRHDNLRDIWLIKLSSQGAIQWQKCLGGSLFDTGYSLVKTKDGGYAVLGWTVSDDGDVSGNHGQSDGWIVKLSSQGIIQWQKCLGGTGNDRLLSMYQTADGGYILTGNTNSLDGGDVSGNHSNDLDVWVVKLSTLGVVEWTKCLGGSDTDIGRSIIQTSDGGYVLTGETSSVNGDVMGYHVDGIKDAWVVKLSSIGVIQWQRCLGGSGVDIGYSIIQTADGGYMVAGFAESHDGDITNPLGQYGDGWLIKLSEQGLLQWQKSLGGSIYDGFSSIIATPDGGFLAAGYTYSYDGQASNFHGGGDAWIVKLSPEIKAIIGQVQQTNTFCQPLVPPQYVSTGQLKIEKNGNVFYTSVDSVGRFNMFVDTGRFIVSVIPPNQLWTACFPQIAITLNQKIRDTIIINPNLYINSICPLMEVQLTTPFLRRCFENTYTINYANKGTGIQNDATAELTLDSALTFVSATRPVRSRVGNKITFSLGNVGINQAGQFTVNVNVSCNSRIGQTHCSSVLIPKTMTCDTVQDSIPTIITQCIAGCDSIAFLISRPNSTVNKTFKYQLIADANLIDTGRFILTNTFNIKHKIDGRTYRLEVRNPTTNQLLVARAAESSPTPSTPSVSTGFVNQSSNGVKISNIAENCTVNRGAFDPNDKAAVPTGVGTNHYIEQGNVIEYMVQFQNTGTDTAFTVVVKDTLAAHFNLSTFKLNATSHPATWQLNPKGILVVTFNNINLVDSFTNERGSHGFFKYSIQLNDSIVTNTIVKNKAGIYFDFNAPIITNLTTHTIGKEPIKNCLIKPTMSVNYSGCPSKNISFTAVSKNSGLNPTYAWFRNSESTPLSTNAVFTLTNAVRGAKIYCKTTSSSDICTETPVITSDTIVLNCIGTPTNDVSMLETFDVYPNPNKGVFTVKLTTIKSIKMQLNILNCLGQTIKSELINVDNYEEQFNLSVLPSGIYLIKVTCNGESRIKKVSIQ